MARTATHHNLAAELAYDEASAQALVLLNTLRRTIAAHQDTAETAGIHWGHVGDMRLVIAQLTNLLPKEE